MTYQRNETPEPLASGTEPRYSFVCANGCGVCHTRLMPFEYERTETLEGELVGSKCRPQVVSACCGSDVHAYDNQTDDWLELVDVRATPAPGAPGQDAAASVTNSTHN